MALFHLQAKIHGRKDSGGTKTIHGVVAYRHCIKFGDHNYSNKKDYADGFVLMPKPDFATLLNSPVFQSFSPEQKQAAIEQLTSQFNELNQHDLAKLAWTEIDKLEKRKDSQLCREFIISLQNELSLEDGKAALKELLQERFKGLFVDVSIHGNEGNPHAHVLIAQRPVELTLNPTLDGFQFKFGKKIRPLEQNLDPVEELNQIRADWARICNAQFKEKGLDLSISHETLKKQRENALNCSDFALAAQLDREPLKHIKTAQILRELEKQGEICKGSDKATSFYNRMVVKAWLSLRSENNNKLKKRLLEEYNNAKQRIKNAVSVATTIFERVATEADELVQSVYHSIGRKQQNGYAEHSARDHQQTTRTVERAASNRATDELDFSDIPEHNATNTNQKTELMEITRAIDQKSKYAWVPKLVPKT